MDYQLKVTGRGAETVEVDANLEPSALFLCLVFRNRVWSFSYLLYFILISSIDDETITGGSWSETCQHEKVEDGLPYLQVCMW